MRDRSDYMREYMRKRRGSNLNRLAKRPAITWLDRLRTRYAAYLRAQANSSAFRSESARLGQPDDLPEHLTRAEADALAALDAHEAQHPTLAAEYYQRHEADRLRKAADRIALHLATLKPKRPRGRPSDLPARIAKAATAAERARAERADTYAHYQRALANPAALDPADATRIQNRWEAAKRRDEQAHDLLDTLRRTQAANEAAAAAQRADTADLELQLTLLREQAAAILAPLPDPPLAPLHAPRTDTTKRRRGRPRIVPADADALNVLTLRYAVHTTETGAQHVIRRATGVRVRSPTLRVPDTATCVRTLDFIEALAPSGLV